MSINESSSSGSTPKSQYGTCEDKLERGVAKETSPLLAAANAVSAHKAFLSRDAAASKQFHEQKRTGNVEKHGNAAGPYLKSLVYGGLDGIITTFATVTSVAGANLAPIVILIVGIAHLFADGFSMGLGDALSTQAEIDYNNSERERESWEMEVDMEEEIQEMIELYEERGISRDDAEQIWRILAKYPSAFLDVMMVEELHLLPPDADDDPWKGGAVTCLAFMAFGVVPLIPFLLAASGFDWSDSTQMTSSVVLTIITLFFLGAIKSQLVALGEGWVKAGFMMAFLGSSAALVSYLVGVVLQQLFNVQA